MKLIYVAGPYRGKTEWDVVQNIYAAEAVALSLWAAGWAVICPHKNTAHFGGFLPDEVWLQGDLEILHRCDAVYAMANCERSEGARREVIEAMRIGIPVFHDLEEAGAAA